MIRFIAVLALSFAGLSWAQNLKTTDPAPESAQRKRLASVTWDVSRGRLVWVVEKGTLEGDEFRVVSSSRYEVSPREAVMEFEKEKRGFAPAEAVALGHLLDILSVYCAESVDWWEDGQGVKLGPNGEEPKREKVHQHQKDRRQTSPGEIAAGLRLAVARTLQ